jgi:chemotaxis protein MotB
MRQPPSIARGKKKPGHERWLVSYADLLTLLVALFVVLYSTTSHNATLAAEVEMGMQSAFHATPFSIQNNHSAGSGVLTHAVSAVKRPVARPAPRLAHLAPAISKKLAAEILGLQKVQQLLATVLAPMIAAKQVSMAAQPLTLDISFDASALFKSGQAALTPPAVAVLSRVAQSLTKLPDQFSIAVQGYTDNQPIHTVQFPSNWSLSAGRAVSVVELFGKSGIDGGRLSAQGFGQFAPFASNATASGRAQNRRVVVVIRAVTPDAP